MQAHSRRARGVAGVMKGHHAGGGQITQPLFCNKRRLLRVMIAEEDNESTETRVEHLMGRKPELRFAFIQEQTALRGKEVIENLDV